MGGQGMGWLALEAFDLAPVAVALTIGPEHRLVYTNHAYRSFVGDRPLGEPIGNAFGDRVTQDYGTLFDRVLATGETAGVVEAPLKLASAGTDEEARYFSFSLSRFTHERPGVLVTAVEVTEQVAAARRAERATEEQKRSRRRFESLVRVSAQTVWVADTAGGIIEPSPGWERLTGQSWEEYRGDGWLRALHPDDREPVVEVWAEARRLARPLQYRYRVLTRDGVHRHFEVRCAPVYEDGVVVEWIGSLADIEERWHREQRAELLGRAAAAAAEHTGLQEMFAALAGVLVPALADGCGVHLLADLGDRPAGAPVVVQRIVTAARDGLRREPPSGEERYAPGSGFARALERRRPVHRTFPAGRPPADLLPRSTTAWLTATAAGSAVLLPVVVDGTVAAAVTVARGADRAPMSREDIALLSRVFEHTHDALSSAVRFHRTQRVALALQHGLLADPPEVAGLRIAARYCASPTAAEVGGDWYDSFVLPDGSIALVIGDVAGHDLAAAVGMSRLRNMLRVLTADRAGPPGKILRRLNCAMDTVAPDATATCVLARVQERDPGHWHVHYAGAGHPPPLLATADGRCRFLQGGTNPLLGSPIDEPYRTASCSLPPGSTLLLYTDGLIERPDEHLDVGLDRLCARASALRRRPLDAFCDGLLDDLPTAGTDDIAVLGARVDS
ncbi:SpoIIE family protein phosphatase [Actinomadura algeriensis]|uniref:PAS domain S-box-containing protein n=1 Tax=Actinomadura algeriensis TaxID=1679523 RepID=A0ABR9K208_9ACTN|nr:SpoIIE family protein phosphatase [Actinomadura algeriensis]MBE1536885.1 PAS domain S-box-containing protein [Actinomadura algeriensis]